MPDASHLTSNPPGTWAEAFAALPQEAPPRDAWAKVSRKLDTRRRKRRPLPAWLGIAAAAAVVAVIAWPHTPAPDDATRRAGAHQDATPTNQTAVANQGTTPMNSIVGATEVATETTHPVATSVAPTTRIPATSTPVEPTHGRLEPGMARLYEESARLEALLALARDENVGNASAMLLADAFDDQVAGIDAALANPALDESERTSLWQARIDALQQAAGFVGTQRLLAAEGRTDALLVSVD